MIIQKWDFAKHEYEDYTVALLLAAPPETNIVLYSSDMDLAINCINCFKSMTYGQGYTSRQYHNQAGLGFPVCEDCYEVERQAESEAA